MYSLTRSYERVKSALNIKLHEKKKVLRGRAEARIEEGILILEDESNLPIPRTKYRFEASEISGYRFLIMTPEYGIGTDIRNFVSSLSHMILFFSSGSSEKKFTLESTIVNQETSSIRIPQEYLSYLNLNGDGHVILLGALESLHLWSRETFTESISQGLDSKTIEFVVDEGYIKPHSIL